MLAVALMLSSCAEKKTFKKCDGTSFVASPYGWANKEKQIDGVDYEINVPKALTVYVECEFHDTSTGASWIINNVSKIGEAICRGLCDYFGISYKSAGGRNSS